MGEFSRLDYEALQKRADIIYARRRLEDVEREIGQLIMQKLYWEEQLKLKETTNEKL